MNYQYVFTTSEKDILDLVSELRYKNTKDKLIKDSQQSNDFSPEEIVRRGVYSEYVVSKYYDLHMNLNCDYRSDFGADLITRGGVTIDVKVTHYENGGIATVPWTEKKDADIFVGCYAPNDLSFCEIFGYIKRHNLITPSKLKIIQTEEGKKQFYLAKRNEIEKLYEQYH